MSNLDLFLFLRFRYRVFSPQVGLSHDSHVLIPDALYGAIGFLHFWCVVDSDNVAKYQNCRRPPAK